ncbi:RT0821/Lpp0805 family surface protein [Aureimonas sp. AU40]|uniref:RT0821/Lpp0805 family surface protein n=1 Tax=Aureimonas sp. AU40 TaxID=1637747 RepID=UPI0007817F21|nr:RT0821/Lpp0805 family surface protein [Aureimonas sp. AU40]
MHGIWKALAASCVLTVLGGCTVMSGKALEDAAKVDHSIQTASLEPAPSPETESDGLTVRNAVSSANLDRTQAEPLAWSNTDTGASGTITAIEETRAGDQICRSFKTSRQRFDGVAVYKGETCTRGSGEWTLTRFNEGG